MTVQPISVSWLTNNKGLIFVGGGGLRGRDFDRIKSEDLERYRAGESLTADQQRSWRRIAHNAMRLSTDGVLFVDLTLFEGFSLFRELVRNLLHERNVKVPDSVQREFFS
jgi:hypothetical protein